jgi:hypothetical protein
MQVFDIDSPVKSAKETLRASLQLISLTAPSDCCGAVAWKEQNMDTLRLLQTFGVIKSRSSSAWLLDVSAFLILLQGRGAPIHMMNAVKAVAATPTSLLAAQPYGDYPSRAPLSATPTAAGGSLPQRQPRRSAAANAGPSSAPPEPHAPHMRLQQHVRWDSSESEEDVEVMMMDQQGGGVLQEEEEEEEEEDEEDGQLMQIFFNKKLTTRKLNVGNIWL